LSRKYYLIEVIASPSIETFSATLKSDAEPSDRKLFAQYLFNISTSGIFSK